MRSKIAGAEKNEKESASLASKALGELLAESEKKGHPVGSESWYRELMEEATVRMAEMRGINAAQLLGGRKKGEFGIGKELERWPEEIWADSHGLGWIHEQYAARGRQESFARHVQDGERHQGMTATTQLYTPRWVADFLVERSFEVAGEATPTVLDPAVGGGQMLLAALAKMVDAAGGEKSPEELVKRLRGVDLDGRAVEAARRSLALEVGKRWGEVSDEAMGILREGIREGDGLFEEVQSAQVVLTNPPYMGWRSMPLELRERLKASFEPYHGDLSAAFIDRCHQLAEKSVGILSQQSIWYLRRFEKARRDLLKRGELRAFLHLGARAFWNLSGEKASVAAFVQAKGEGSGGVVRVWDLRRPGTTEKKARAFLEDQKGEEMTLESFAGIPGAPLAHDLPEELRRLFGRLAPLSEFAELPSQNKTGKNRRYLHSFGEVPEGEIRRVEALGGRGSDEGRWVFYSKGGRFAPWWGNWDSLVDWSEEARNFYARNRTSNLLDEKYWFREGIVYTDFGGKRFNARWMPPGCLFDMTGPAIFLSEAYGPGLSQRERIGFFLAVLNSTPARRMLRALNPTLHFQVRDVRALPIPEVEEELCREVSRRVWRLIEGVRDWHREVPGDPLFDVKGGGEPMELRKLVEWEEEIDGLISEAYGVKRRRLEKASVGDHHQLVKLGGALRAASSK